MSVVFAIMLLWLDCGDFDEISGPPAECACVDMVNSASDE